MIKYNETIDFNDLNINEQEELYIEAKRTYYAGVPIMPDEAFDELEEILRNAGSKVVEMVDGDETEGERFPHKNPMLSLEKIQVFDVNNIPIENVRKFFQRQPTTERFFMEATPKFDGSAMSLIYNDGKLEQALTRGNELGGLDRTGKIKKIVPTKINVMGMVEIRGEIVIGKEIFNKKYLGEFANPRNFVAGKIAKDDLDDETLQDLHFIAYHLVIDADSDPTHVENTIEELEKLGFNKHHKFLVLNLKSDVGSFVEAFKRFTEYREKESPYQLDGFVLKFPTKYRKNLGQNNHHPKWAMAIKFPPKEAQTVIADIIWEQGTTGKFTPVAICNPTDLDGSMVRRASLHNYGKIKKENAYIGAVVIIIKKGDIIPQVDRIITPSTSGISNAPSVCPTCSSKLSIIKGNKEETLHLMCVNEDCDMKAEKKFIRGVQKLKIEECGGPTVVKYMKAGITNIIELFDKNKFNKQKLIASGAFKEGRELENKLNSIQKIKQLKLEDVIDSLKFKDSGSSISKAVALHLAGTEQDFKGLNKEAIKRLTDKDSAERIKLQDFLDVLMLNGIDVVFPIKEVISSDTITYEQTGTPPKVGDLKTKADWAKMFKEKGCVHSALNKDTKVLITDSYSSSSSKMDKARKLGVEILTYEDFVDKYCK